MMFNRFSLSNGHPSNAGQLAQSGFQRIGGSANFRGKVSHFRKVPYQKILVKFILSILVLLNLTSCSSPKSCESMDSLIERIECEQQMQIEGLTNLLSFGFLGVIAYLFLAKPPAFLRFTHSAFQAVDTLLDEQSKEPAVIAFNEILKLTGGYFDGSKHIFQEVRPQDRDRIKELCQFLLDQFLLENFEEKAEILYTLATSLEEEGKDIAVISKLRKHAEEQKIIVQSIRDLFDRLKD